MEGGATGRLKSGTGSREELHWSTQQGREVQTSGGGRRAGSPSKWTVAPRPGEIGGGEKRVQIEREAESTGEMWGGDGR